MKVTIILFGFLLLLCLPAIGGQAADPIQSREEFAATGYMPTIAGSTMVGPGATAQTRFLAALGRRG